MIVESIVAALTAEGVELALWDGRLFTRPSVRDRPSLLSIVRSHRTALRQFLEGRCDPQAEREALEERAAIMEFDGGLAREEAERAARGINALALNQPTYDPTPLRWRGAELDLGDLRPCLWCRNLTAAGRCLSAWRGELRQARDWQPTFPNQPMRCIGYRPPDDDPDQRPGTDRWPELVAWQARLGDGSGTERRPAGRVQGEGKLLRLRLRYDQLART